MPSMFSVTSWVHRFRRAVGAGASIGDRIDGLAYAGSTIFQ